ncbi:MAG: hypothetical protein EXS00_06125 [Phycisphaerales bacterium]|nr:hypothetical protein [Phycisphaerales bacterium]
MSEQPVVSRPLVFSTTGVSACIWAMVSLTVALLPACASNETGYALGNTFSDKYRSVSVPIFKSDAFDRKVAPQLADALVKAIESQSPFKVTREATADTVLRGTITAVQLQQLSKSVATGLSEEMAFTVTIDYDWVDMRTGKPIVTRRGLKESAVFVASRPNNEPIDLGRFQVVDMLAQSIVGSMQGEW